MMRRRRFLTITAAAAGLPLATSAGPALHSWRGTALGAEATLQLYHPDADAARRLIAACLAEVARLERQLSLYQPDSALVRLNLDGRLDDPPFDLLRVLSEADRFHRLTGGAFDVTVQPLWDLYAAYFATPDASPGGPPAEAVAEAVSRVGQPRMTVTPRHISLSPGMRLTLNGIGQGYVTDRVVDLLRRQGMVHALVDMGETRAIGSHPDGTPWRVGLEDSVGPIAETISLLDRAVSTSGGYGTSFDPAGRFNHIFDPSSGKSSWRYRAVSVIADDATTADALSTAFALLPPEGISAIALSRRLDVHIARIDGSRFSLPSPTLHQ